MNRVKKAYQYLFYKLYKLWEAVPSPWWSDAKAIMTLIVLLSFTLLSLVIYFRVFINKYINPIANEWIVIIVVLFLSGYNYYLFTYKDKWKAIVKKFDKLPKVKNRIGGVIVWSFVFLVIANLVYAFYLMSQIDWSQYQ